MRIAHHGILARRREDPETGGEGVAGSSAVSGRWSNPATWFGGIKPTVGQTAIISAGHTVIYDEDTTTVDGVQVRESATLEFDPAKSNMLISDNTNIIIEGVLRIRPNALANLQEIIFDNIDEDNFVGFGMDVVDTDVGLWVMENGVLDIEGTFKTPWTRVTDTVAAGATSFSLSSSPVQWNNGDEIVLVPTNTPGETLDFDDGTNKPTDPYWVNFEHRILNGGSGTSRTVSSGFTYNTHQKVVTSDGGPVWTAEIFNLHRNVQIKGTSTGRSHLFIRSTQPQNIQNVQFRHMGPRKNQGGSARPDMVAGRYCVHFHHCNYGSAGSQVNGNIVWQHGNHAFVPHGSHAITMNDNVAYDGEEMQFWWDFGHMSHYIRWERNLMAKNYYTAGALDAAGSEGTVAFTGTGMLLGIGDGNIANDNVLVHAGLGDSHGKGGYIWEANNEGIWIFERNMAHSNHIGIRVWQNTVRNHTVFDQICYNNIMHLFHGAYGNAYTYHGGYFYGTRFDLKATSANSVGVRFEKMTFDGADSSSFVVQIEPSPIPSGENNPDLFIDCTFKNYTSYAFLMKTVDIPEETVTKNISPVNCTFESTIAAFAVDSADNSYFKVQPLVGTPTRITASGTTNISAFVPSFYGTGKGLLGTYYNGSNFDSFALERIDSVIMYTEWTGDSVFYDLPYGVHHLITGVPFSVRWEGEVEPQVTGSHIFPVRAAGGSRLWVNGVQILNSWTEKFDMTDVVFSSAISLTQGVKYSIVLEYFNSGGNAGCALYWQAPGIPDSLIPQSQLYYIEA